MSEASYPETPLSVAAWSSLKKTKMLLEAGANVNLKTMYNASALNSAADGANQAEITKYLLDKGADCNTVLGKTIDGDTLRLVNSLRKWTYPLDSKEYKIKMEIVDLLKDCGQDYWSTPIPKQYYKNYDLDYLEKY